MSDTPPVQHEPELISQTPSVKQTGRVITVALDESERSRDAFCWAIANMYKKSSDDKVVLLHATEPPPSVWQGGFSSSVATAAAIHQAHEAEKDRGRALLQTYQNYCNANNVTFEARHYIGNPHHVILEVPKQNYSCALIVGSSKKTGSERFFLGSTSESAAHNSPVPVVIVKRPHEMSLDPDKGRKIGVCVNSSAHAQAAFDWALNELYRDGDTLFILHMSQVKRYEPDETLEDKAAIPKDSCLDHFSCLCFDASIPYHVINSRTRHALSDAMVDLVDLLKLDCLVVGCRGRGAIKRTIFGSFSDGVVRKCECNIVVVKKQDGFD